MDCLLKKVPLDIYNLIINHFYSKVIQTIFKINRPLTILNIGDRIYSLTKKKIYGTIINIKNNYSEILLLPRIIPFWKKCNINFWLNNKNFLKDCFYTDFPYYSPIIKINNNKIIKLNNWNLLNNNDLDGTFRLNQKFNNFNFSKKSNLFNYYY